LAQLRREVRVLREERDILKRATAFFAFLGDPVNVFSFIEAEKVGQGNVTKACVMLEVYRSAFYDCHQHRPLDPEADRRRAR
jgi:hypothetical protein